MTAPIIEADTEWMALAELEEKDRLPVVKRRFDELAQEAFDERFNALRRMLAAEQALDGDGLTRMTLSRLRAWLAMNPDKAQLVAATLDAARNDLEGTCAPRTVRAVQEAVSRLAAAEVDNLSARAPSFRHVISCHQRDTGRSWRRKLMGPWTAPAIRGRTRDFR